MPSEPCPPCKERRTGIMSGAPTLVTPRPRTQEVVAPMPRYSSTYERFWSKVDKNGPVPECAPHLGPCWLWTAHRLTNGYGQFRDGRTTVYAHRWVYEYFNGPFPPNTETDHLCSNRICVRPDHLEAVTRWENLRRAGTVARTHCKRGHEFTEANIIWEFVNKRWWTRKCRICWRAKEQRRNVRRRGVSRKKVS